MAGDARVRFWRLLTDLVAFGASTGAVTADEVRAFGALYPNDVAPPPLPEYELLSPKQTRARLKREREDEPREVIDLS
jgi:hypothetical protein